MEQKSSQPPPTYSQATHGESSSNYADVPPEPSDVHGPMVRGPDIAYLKSVGGIVKIVEAVSEIVI